VILVTLLSAVWLSNAVAERKDEAATWLSQQLGYPVSIGEAELYFLDVFPKLHLRNVHILDSQKSVAEMSINHIYLDIDLLASIQQRHPVLNAMTVDEASIHLHRDIEGEFSIRGLEKLLIAEGKTSSSPDKFPVTTVDINQLAVSFVDENKPLFTGHYRLDNATLNVPEHSKLLINANTKLPSHLGESVQLSGAFIFKANTFELEQWQGQLRAINLSLNSVSTLSDLDDIEITQGIVTVNLTQAAFDADTNELKAKGRVELADIAVLPQQHDKTPVTINKISAPLELMATPEKWSLKTDALLLELEKQSWPKIELGLLADADRYQFQMTYLNLADVAALITPFMTDGRQQFSNIETSGEVTDVMLDYSVKTGLNSVSANLNNVAVNRTEKIPGISGLTAQIKWSDQQGYMLLDSQNIIIDAGESLPEVVTLDVLTGKAMLQKKENTWVFNASDLHINNEDFSLSMNGSVSHSELMTVPNINVALENTKVASWKKYVPLDILSDDFREWSEFAFRAGVINHGDISLSGDLAEFPYLKKEQKGEFKMDLTVSGMQLDYGVGWPHLFDVDGKIVGDGKLLTITSEHGRIADFTFHKLRTDIDNYLVSKPVLTTKGQVDGTTQKALNFLKNSPLQDRFGQIASSFSAKGETSIILDLEVPLTNVDAATAKGTISFQNSQLITEKDVDIQLHNVNGLLSFDGDGVTGKNLSATFLEQPIHIDVLPSNKATVIAASGDMPVKALFQKWPELNADFVSGSAPMKTLVSVSEQQRGVFELDVSIRSPLTGVEIDMPAPFGKSVTEKRELTVSIHEHNADSLAYKVEYADLLSAYVQVENERVNGEIRLGAGKAQLADTGLSLKGQLEQVDVVKWQSWQNTQSNQQKQGVLADLDVVSLNINKLTGISQSVTNIAMIAEKSAQDWRVNIQSDQLKGSLNWPLTEQLGLPIVIDLDYLYLQTPQVASSQATPPLTSLWPSVHFHTEHLYIDKMKLGALSFTSRQLETQWIIDSFLLDSASYQAEGNVVWGLRDGISQTQLNMNANTTNLKAVLADFGYQQAIEAKQAEFTVALNWSGAPTELSLANLSGTTNLKVGAGKLLDVQPGAAGRIFGLMSITAIPRRLTLDFSDLFSKGFNFSSISGEFVLADGIANTSNLAMAGEAARIEVKGPIDLVEKRYNQSVKVTPNVSSTLPVAGAVAGGPVGLGVGAAILLVDKIADNLFGKEIVNLVSYNYKLTGPWAEPELSTLRAGNR
jgi:uncharacterized protein (TIGR02099 family)